MRYHGADGQTGTELARHGLASDPRNVIPNLTALGFDTGDIEDSTNGGQSFTRIQAADANLFLLIEYGGGNSGAEPAGIPTDESHDGALELLTNAADRLPCPTPNC